MTNNIAKIRKALIGSSPWTSLTPQADALAALAELERAASEPVAYQYAHPYFGGGKIWRQEQRWNGHTSDEARALYAAPPAPVAEIREVEITDAMALRISEKYHGIQFEADFSVGLGRDMIAAVRAELCPALGLVELKEPTPEECERIYAFWLSAEGCSGRTPGERMGGLMFNAVRAVMWPKSEGL